MFVYGTLLRGEALELAFFDRDAARTVATLNGYALHYAPHTRSYPVIVPLSGGVVVGELVYADRADIGAALRMEERAGYVTKQVTVDLAATVCSALVAAWPGPRVGTRIPSGDWRQR